jgi:hypothetical protein
MSATLKSLATDGGWGNEAEASCQPWERRRLGGTYIFPSTTHQAGGTPALPGENLQLNFN